jgi:hypothetical protein
MVARGFFEAKKWGLKKAPNHQQIDKLNLQLSSSKVRTIF